METLPAEMIEKIAMYLEHEDILSCSQVSWQWEKAFNLNSIWKRFLTFETNYFEKRLSKLNYTLKKSHYRYGVEPCQYKDFFYKELFVKKNFMSGNFNIEEINLGSTYLDCLKEVMDKAGNHWLFLSLFDGQEFEGEHQIQVWSLNCNPSFHTQMTTPAHIKRHLDSQMKMFGDRLFYINDASVSAYDFAHPQYELKFLFKIEPPFSRFPNQTFMTHKMVCFPDSIICFTYTNFHVLQDSYPSYEVWSHDGMSVSNNFDQLLVPQNIEFITCFPNMLAKMNNGKIVIVIYHSFNATFLIIIFDSVTLSYSEISVEKTGKLEGFDVWGKYLVLLYKIQGQFGRCMVELLNVERGNSLFCCDFDFETLSANSFEGVQLMPNSNLIAFSMNVLAVFSMSAVVGLSHVISFKIPNKDGSVSGISNDFIILPNFQKGNYYYELCDYKTGLQMYRIQLPKSSLIFNLKEEKSTPASLIAYTDPNLVYGQQITKNSVFMISFW